MALYRVGAWEDAISVLEKSETLEPGKHVAENGFFLAMSHWRRSEKERARQWYEKAVAGMNADDDDLRLFQDEASALLASEGAVPRSTGRAGRSGERRPRPPRRRGRGFAGPDDRTHHPT